MRIQISEDVKYIIEKLNSMGVFKGNSLFASIAATNSHKTFCSMLAPAQGCDLCIC